MEDSKNAVLWTLVLLQTATLSLLTLMFFNTPARTGDGGIQAAGGRTSVTGQSAPITELQAEMRALRAEIAALGKMKAESVPADKASNETLPELPEQELQLQEQAIAASNSIVRQAMSAGVWTWADSQALMPHVTKLPAGQRRALMEELYGAINRQEVRLQAPPPL